MNVSQTLCIFYICHQWFVRNAEKDEVHFETCLQSLVEEITFNAGHLLPAEEPQRESVNQPEPLKSCLKKKPGRGFRHALSQLHICDSGSYRYKTLYLSYCEQLQSGP